MPPFSWVIQHLEPDRLPALADAVFGFARPKAVIITTPNAEYNMLFLTSDQGCFRHPDHRFEWSRAEFEGWAGKVAEMYGYNSPDSCIGPVSEDHGSLAPRWRSFRRCRQAECP